MDFKIGDDFNENGPVKHELLNKNTKILLIVGGAVVIGLLLLLIILLINSGNDEETKVVNTKTTLSVDDKIVVASYKMVTFGYNEGRNNKFLMGIGLDVNSFNNQEKYYYALQYCVKKDLTKTTETDGVGHYIYTIPKSYMDAYMERVFGSGVEYETSNVINYTFKFDIDGCNTGTLTYDSAIDSFKILLNSSNTIKESQETTYYKLDKAYTEKDDEIILEEKVIYSSLEQNNGKQTMILYGDALKTTTLGTITDIVTESNGTSDISKDQSEYYANLSYSFDFDEYKDNASTIIYTFKKGEYGYYFVKSEIE